MVRRILTSVLHQQTLSDEGFYTGLFEVEAILNDCPITKSGDPNNLEALTPNHPPDVQSNCHILRLHPQRCQSQSHICRHTEGTTRTKRSLLRSALPSQTPDLTQGQRVSRSPRKAREYLQKIVMPSTESED